MNRLPQSTVHCKSLVVFWKVGLKIIFLLKSCSHTYPLFYFLWTLIRNNKVRFQISFLSIWRNWTEVCWKKVLILNKKRKWPVSQDIFSRHISPTNVDMIHTRNLHQWKVLYSLCECLHGDPNHQPVTLLSVLKEPSQNESNLHSPVCHPRSGDLSSYGAVWP